jgi:hypothetical protein
MSANDLTHSIAAEAARLIADTGMEYGAAKAKAARSLGHRRVELPSNEAVEDELREHLALFCADSQPLELQALRQVALRWMERLAMFSPHLTGAVWRGTSTSTCTATIRKRRPLPSSIWASRMTSTVWGLMTTQSRS